MIVFVKFAWSKFNYNSDYYENLISNYTLSGNISTENQVEKSPKLVVFIGESTSALNLGAYGYFRDTTPFLSDLANRKSKNTLLFKNVFSTHVHTQQSLLEALSVSSQKVGLIGTTIQQRSRSPLIDILNSAGYKTRLVTNQARSGSWNLVEPIIFRSATSIDSTMKAASLYTSTLEFMLDRPEEGGYFESKLDEILKKNENKEVLFFHSYAGHFFYYKLLPEAYSKPIDNLLDKVELDDIFGDLPGPHAYYKSSLELADSSYRYIDNILKRMISRIESDDQPIVFVYFSDHGDALYSGLNHDSSRFEHEMAQVPFIVYFNSAAKSQYSSLYDRYYGYSLQENTSTLAQFPDTVFDLLQIDVSGADPIGVIGSEDRFKRLPILFRETDCCNTYVNLFGSEKLAVDADAVDTTGYYTKIFAKNRENKNICPGVYPSIASIVKVSFVADCMFMNTDSSKEESDNETALGVLKAIPELAKNKLLWLRVTGVLSDEQCNSILEGSSVFPNSTKFVFELDYESITVLGDSKSCITLKETNGFTLVANMNKVNMQEGNLNLGKYGVTSISVEYGDYLSSKNSELFVKYDSFIHLEGNILDAEDFPDKIQLISTRQYPVN